MMNQLIATDALHELMEKPGETMHLIDVRLPADYAAAHLPGAVNACVFEMGFGDNIKQAVPDVSDLVVVYGAHASSYESRVALEKLLRLGFTNVHEYRVGLAGWPGEVVRDQEAPAVDDEDAPQVRDGRHLVDLEQSEVHWVGRNLLNHHEGSIRLQNGFVHISDGQLVGGEFMIDMTSMRCSDLAGDAMHDVLIAHLESDDFFDVEKFPTAAFCIETVERLPVTAPGRPDLRITGDLRIRDVDVPIEFDAVTGVTADGVMAAQASLKIDRTLWGVLYGSGSFFANLGMHLVNDLVAIDLKVVIANDG
ncbi:YceI family protein [Sulfuriroseicoccus oceanibius]|uniref:YceI family protein n=1 Tax=Sulfuriroseicoccus oceanibius TaxID=2707525 RepID=A0A6B3LCP5_9BACT|nr:YceI family protein [Sulfuriroseicoccus oceanibius]QQL45387.1 YceI family protein [Sulfuriroseicoccus oceanibius]